MLSLIYPPRSSLFSLPVRDLILANDAAFLNYLRCLGLPEPDSEAPVSPQGTVPEPYSFPLSKVKPTKLSGGSVKVVDSTTFKISKTITAAEVTVEPGAIRELHAGDIGRPLFMRYVPTSMGHYVENTGNTTLKFLEIFNTDIFQDISLNQWLALTPAKLVKEHLGISDDVVSKLSKTKNTVVGSK
ncbi:hypothetical protein H0H81_008735 [Sphagnurus paluster]|uniref:Cupin type-1 domain-containing protein n=1 Tax=Sphagnurus paluster TaxID=117069 RepID=A0A9P7FTZ9_9AGAR|nr:hypothetical protein H0H81_008735 [Sphagnurus paluster]